MSDSASSPPPAPSVVKRAQWLQRALTPWTRPITQRMASTSPLLPTAMPLAARDALAISGRVQRLSGSETPSQNLGPTQPLELPLYSRASSFTPTAAGTTVQATPEPEPAAAPASPRRPDILSMLAKLPPLKKESSYDRPKTVTPTPAPLVARTPIASGEVPNIQPQRGRRFSRIEEITPTPVSAPEAPTPENNTPTNSVDFEDSAPKFDGDDFSEGVGESSPDFFPSAEVSPSAPATLALKREPAPTPLPTEPLVAEVPSSFQSNPPSAVAAPVSTNIQRTPDASTPAPSSPSRLLEGTPNPSAESKSAPTVFEVNQKSSLSDITQPAASTVQRTTQPSAIQPSTVANTGVVKLENTPTPSSLVSTPETQSAATSLSSILRSSAPQTTSAASPATESLLPVEPSAKAPSQNIQRHVDAASAVPATPSVEKGTADFSGELSAISGEEFSGGVISAPSLVSDLPLAAQRQSLAQRAPELGISQAFPIENQPPASTPPYTAKPTESGSSLPVQRVSELGISQVSSTEDQLPASTPAYTVKPTESGSSLPVQRTTESPSAKAQSTFDAEIVDQQPNTPANSSTVSATTTPNIQRSTVNSEVFPAETHQSLASDTSSVTPSVGPSLAPVASTPVVQRASMPLVQALPPQEAAGAPSNIAIDASGAKPTVQRVALPNREETTTAGETTLEFGSVGDVHEVPAQSVAVQRASLPSTPTTPIETTPALANQPPMHPVVQRTAEPSDLLAAYPAEKTSETPSTVQRATSATPSAPQPTTVEATTALNGVSNVASAAPSPVQRTTSPIATETSAAISLTQADATSQPNMQRSAFPSLPLAENALAEATPNAQGPVAAPSATGSSTVQRVSEPALELSSPATPATPLQRHISSGPAIAPIQTPTLVQRDSASQPPSAIPSVGSAPNASESASETTVSDNVLNFDSDFGVLETAPSPLAIQRHAMPLANVEAVSISDSSALDTTSNISPKAPENPPIQRKPTPIAQTPIQPVAATAPTASKSTPDLASPPTPLLQRHPESTPDEIGVTDVAPKFGAVTQPVQPIQRTPTDISAVDSPTTFAAETPSLSQNSFAAQSNSTTPAAVDAVPSSVVQRTPTPVTPKTLSEPATPTPVSQAQNTLTQLVQTKPSVDAISVPTSVEDVSTSSTTPRASIVHEAPPALLVMPLVQTMPTPTAPVQRIAETLSQAAESQVTPEPITQRISSTNATASLAPVQRTPTVETPTETMGEAQTTAKVITSPTQSSEATPSLAQRTPITGDPITSVEKPQATSTVSQPLTTEIGPNTTRTASIQPAIQRQPMPLAPISTPTDNLAGKAPEGISIKPLSEIVQARAAASRLAQSFPPLVQRWINRSPAPNADESPIPTVIRPEMRARTEPVLDAPTRTTPTNKMPLAGGAQVQRAPSGATQTHRASEPAAATRTAETDPISRPALTTSATSVQRFFDDGSTTASAETATVATETASTPKAAPPNFDLDNLAREVYPYIRRLLAIERERRSLY